MRRGGQQAPPGAKVPPITTKTSDGRGSGVQTMIGLPCNTIIKISKGQIVVTCEQHPWFRVPMTVKPVKTGTPDEIARFHRENPEAMGLAP